ncbi:GntR family transcriptional regulator [Acuticoccus sp. MNP-M23]|uniref:GntR family transcriptional regulator n=1 Tax=Acuticoccus sp. MNP-M23 TaxID=3072793 RepID=UPI002815CF32|nr:GntR family transcriptional regulator [Acuticoccus sp. MNP-M23]WMS44455.1 GntR family transcriptional regulator [Acuticoccus sp. MNP-M23]
MPTDRTPSSLQGEDAYNKLLGEIRTGALGPGARLTETDLARRLNISRTPVREAIRQLEADGLVIHQPRVGATIRTLDYSEVMELYEMRTVLEGTAARLAARSASEMEVAELAAINDEMRAPGLTGQRLFVLNQQFHLTMLDAARNRYLSRSVHALQKTLLILGPSTLEEASRASEVVGEHDTVLDALRARDGLAAEALMRKHIEASHRARLRQLRLRNEKNEQ